MMAPTLALLFLFTIGAGAAVARLLPPRLALFELPTIWARGPASPGTVLRGATGSPASGSGGDATATGVTASLDRLITSGNLGPRVGALVTDLSTGQVLYQLNPTVGLAPASTTKIVTAIAALGALGPGSRFTTKVIMGPGGRAGGGGSGRTAGGSSSLSGGASVVLVGGGDPTLAAGGYPGSDYPQPATLRSLAAANANAPRAQGLSSVPLRYDASLLGRPQGARRWAALGAADHYVSNRHLSPT